MGTKIYGQIRAIVPLVAGILVALNIISEDDAKVISDQLAIVLGAVSQITVHAWSWQEKKGQGL